VPTKTTFTLPLLLIAALAISPIYLYDASAKPIIEPEYIHYKALLQLQLFDKNGQLVSYVEGSKIVLVDPELLDRYLDALPNKKIIEKDGKKYDLFQWVGPHDRFDKDHSMSTYTHYVWVGNAYVAGLMVLHNSYPVQPGDTTNVYWTVLRPV
jgi:hypothetical protein